MVIWGGSVKRWGGEKRSTGFHLGQTTFDRIDFARKNTIDLGPEGGSDGGEIVAEGTPEDVAKIKKSFTGNFLKDILS